jgi:K(+)-stimulated pyrophosphate-energized sodium pump
MKEISTYIAEGAMAFLKAEWKILGYFVAVVALLLGFMANSNPESHWSIAIAFVIGAVFSATAGYINCQRQFGAQSGVASAYITMNSAVNTITFNYITKNNFPYTINDSSGYALYICFNIIN